MDCVVALAVISLVSLALVLSVIAVDLGATSALLFVSEKVVSVLGILPNAVGNKRNIE